MARRSTAGAAALMMALVFAVPAQAGLTPTSPTIAEAPSDYGWHTPSRSDRSYNGQSNGRWGRASADLQAGWGDTSNAPIATPEDSVGSLVEVRSQVGLDRVRQTGRGVDIATIDSGVVPVDGLDTPGRIVNGPDLSFESHFEDVRYLDTFGHGTHLAGIMVSDADDIPGIAPGARLVSLKVATHDGAVDVTQVLAAIDWVIQYRTYGDLNIRVLNLAYGTDSFNDADEDLLSFAVEQAWKAGITVVVAGGNGGNGSRQLTSPAYNPYVISVGAVDGSLLGTRKNPVTEFSSCSGDRTVDLVAPGRSIVSLRNPGSLADTLYPEAATEDGRGFVGSGTSQAAAVVSGAVAVLLEHRPTLTPDQVKYVLTRSADSLRSAAAHCVGAGLLDVQDAMRMRPTRRATQRHNPTEATGTLQNSRGSMGLEMDGTVLEGEIDIFGQPFDVASWAERSRTATAWSDGVWNGTAMTGTGFDAPSWAGPAWSGVTWSGVTWSGVTWSGVTWSGGTWSGGTWSGGTWSGGTWSGGTWSGGTWSGGTWSGGTWSGGTWSGGTWSGLGWQ